MNEWVYTSGKRVMSALYEAVRGTCHAIPYQGLLVSSVCTSVDRVCWYSEGTSHWWSVLTCTAYGRKYVNSMRRSG